MVKAKLAVSGAQFARMSGVKPQTIISAAKSGLVIKVGKDYFLEEPANVTYLKNHGCNLSNYIKSIQKEENIKDPEKNNVRHRDTGDKGPKDPEDTKNDLDKILLKERARDFRIRNEIRLKNLITKKIAKRYMGELDQVISVSLVDLPRRYAVELAALFERPDKERDGELFLSRIIQKSIENILEKINTISKGENF